MALWTPKNISTALWLDASDSSTLFDAVSGGSTPADNAGIARWQDKSGNARHFTQSTSTARPTRQTNETNGLDVVRFDGSDDVMSIASSTSMFNFLHEGDSLIACVWRHGTLANPNAAYILLDNSDFGSTHGFTLAYDDRSSISRNDNFRVLANGATSLSFIYSQAVNNASTPNRYALWSHSGAATASPASLRSIAVVDGAIVGQTNTATNNSTGSAAVNMTLGAQAIGAFFLAGDVCELVIANDATTVTRQLAEGYLAWKWGTQVNLPANHPYRFAAPGARFRSSFSTRYTYKPPKAKVFEGVRVRDHDYASLRQGLVGAWCPSLPSGGSGNTLPDQSGRGNHGTLTNMGPEDWVSSGEGRALDFDGVDDYVAVKPLAVSKTTQLTISCFLSCTASGTIFSDWNIPTNPGYSFEVRGGGNNYLAFGMFSADGSTAIRAGGATVLTDGVWRHAAVSYDGSGSANGIKLYVNGNIEAMTVISNTDPGTLVNTVAQIAARNGSTAISSKLDDIRIYNRALSESEIRLLASRRGIGLQNPRDELLFHQLPSGSSRRLLLTGQT